MDKGQILSVMAALAGVLSIRLYLLLAIIGAFVLGFLSMQDIDVHSLWTLGIYCGFTILPLVYLDIKTRTR